MWIAREKASGEGKLGNGRSGGRGHFLKFLVLIFLPFILSALVSYFS